jgi:flagellar hook-associated protein 3 FlgL
MFEVLDDLEAQILAGNEAGIASGILSLDVARERLESMRISVGVRTSTLEAIRTQRAVATETLTRQASAAEDADLAKSAIELSSAEVAYNATLSVAARIFQTSLVDFLR